MDGHEPLGQESTEPTERPRDGRGKFAPSLSVLERDTEAVLMYSRGHTYAEIAATLGYADRHHARNAVKKRFREAPVGEVAELRAGQLALIGRLKLEALGVLERDHYTISQGGKIVEKDGKPLLDDGPKLAAINTLDRLIARESVIAGTPAPVRTKVELGDGGEERAELKQLLAEARARLTGGGMAEGDAAAT